MSEKLLDMSVVRIDGDTQPRTAISPAVVQEYMEDMQAGAEFPPVTVVHDGATYWLVDGFHRFFAHRRLNRKEILAEVVTGEWKDARWLSVAANKTHGLRRTNEDKAKAVTRALRLRPDLSDRAIAEHIGVSNDMVSRYRHALEQRKSSADQLSQNDSSHRLGRDGRRRAMPRRTGGIAKNAFTPIRTSRPPLPTTAVNLPHNRRWVPEC
jgi:ParB-like chromosome segregation protein Spo0J